MVARQILLGILIALAFVFLGLQIAGQEVIAGGIRALLLLFLTAFYCVKVKEKHRLFLAFLITFSVAEVLNFFGWTVPLVPANEIDFYYYCVNGLYIVAYIFLIIKTVISLDYAEILRKYPFHLMILIVLDVFSVIVVTNTALQILSFHEYVLELVYNSVIMILLSVAVINFIHKHNKKAVNLMVGSIFLFFSEIIQLAYFYVSDMNLLNVMSSLFLLLAFIFFLLQSTLPMEPRKNLIYKEA